MLPHQIDQDTVISEEESLTHEEDEVRMPGNMFTKQDKIRVGSFQEEETETYTRTLSSSELINSETYQSNGSQEICSNEETANVLNKPDRKQQEALRAELLAVTLLNIKIELEEIYDESCKVFASEQLQTQKEMIRQQLMEKFPDQAIGLSNERVD